MLLTCVLLVQSFLSGVNGAEESFDALAYQSVGDIEFTFPEQEYASVLSRPNVGVTFSGGGDRSFLATTGTLAAFHELGLVDNIRYIAGSSGGSWGASVYTFFQHDEVPDSVMLGPVVFPSNITLDGLEVMAGDCVRRYPNSSYPTEAVGTTYDDWLAAVQAIYLTPSGVGRGVAFSYDKATVADIRRRNPALQDSEFLLPRGNFNESSPGIDKRPYMIIQGTMNGPRAEMPWNDENRNYSMLEWTPLTAGVAYSHQVAYHGLNTSYYALKTIGGFVEPFAFGGKRGPVEGLPVGASSGTLSVPADSDATIYCDVAMATGTSSWAPGCFYASTSDLVTQSFAGKLDYWAPSAPSPEGEFAEVAVGDGGGVSNTDLISLLQRNVTSIIAFVNTNTPLQNSTHWNPATDALSTQIDFTVPAWFGQICQNLTDEDKQSFDLGHSQVFRADEWVSFAQALQTAQAAGNGVVVSLTHTTAHNPHYGVVGGRSVKVLWVYLASRVFNWEAQLPAQMQELLVPDEDPDNQAAFPQTGEFKDFPGYVTSLASDSVARCNLLADLAGWLVYQNLALFQEVMGVPVTEPTNQGDSSHDTFETSAVGLSVIVIGGVGVILVAVAAMYFALLRRKDAVTNLIHEVQITANPVHRTEDERGIGE